MNIKGSCLCGLVTFIVSNNFSNMYACFCQQCRKITGSAFASNLFTSLDTLEWTSGREYIEFFTVKNRDISKAFCQKCGSGVPFLSSSGKSYLVPAGCLDDEPIVNKIEQIFCKEKSELEAKRIGSPAHDGFPE
jgi:hypothetical protein